MKCSLQHAHKVILEGQTLDDTQCRMDTVKQELDWERLTWYSVKKLNNVHNKL